MNITLSADPMLIEKAREYAQSHNTSLNQIIRDYLIKLVSESDGTQIGNEFSSLALEYAGESEPDYRFTREAIYNRRVKY